MDIVLNGPRLQDPMAAGNKAATLARLRAAGFNVPPFFTIAAGAYELPPVSIGGEVTSALQSICGDNDALAVRSSAPEEDGAQHSFAGQFDSFLDIAPDQVVDYAIRVMQSGSSEHVAAYRAAQGRTGTGSRPAVLVQRMVRADSAGVAFAADPVSGATDRAVIAATRGNGHALVNGETGGDTWHVDPAGHIVLQTLSGAAASLSAHQVNCVAELVRAVSAHIGRPQDIEWAYSDGRLYLLQSRDITTIQCPREDGIYALWDNSNIVESYGGITLPLTFSVARAAYQEAYRHLGRAIGISEKTIVRNAPAYEQMIGLIGGRVYYNLLNWYRLLMLTPGFRFNQRFMEQMMGVTEGLPQSALPVGDDGGVCTRLRSIVGMTRVACRLFLKLFAHNRNVRHFHKALERYLRPIDLDAMPLDALLDAYETLQAQVIPSWNTPLLNDLYCMIFHGALRGLGERWLDETFAGIHNDLVSGESAIISVEPVRRMRQMAQLAADDPELVSALCEAPLATIEHVMNRHTVFSRQLQTYLDKFGDRCLDELKLESRTLRDDPLPLLRTIGRMPGSDGDDEPGATSRADAEARIERVLHGAPVRRAIYKLVLGLARSRLRDRENLRFERTRVYGRVRMIFLSIGKRLRELQVIGNAQDIFYLDVAEITAYIRGTGCTGKLEDLVACRQREFAMFAADENPPRRFVTCGPPQLRSAMRQEPVTELDDARMRQGQACSRGVVRGRVRIVRDPRATDFVKGEVLVAERTDPGWVTIFPLAGGMIMERGSLLSHSAIVARELNIPAVVGVADASRWLRDGDWVELDGTTGIIRKLAAPEAGA